MFVSLFFLFLVKYGILSPLQELKKILILNCLQLMSTFKLSPVMKGLKCFTLRSHKANYLFVAFTGIKLLKRTITETSVSRNTVPSTLDNPPITQ